MWELRRLTTLWAFTDCYRDSLTFSLLLLFREWCGEPINDGLGQGSILGHRSQTVHVIKRRVSVSAIVLSPHSRTLFPPSTHSEEK
jgi:hypothetical protein